MKLVKTYAMSVSLNVKEKREIVLEVERRVSITLSLQASLFGSDRTFSAHALSLS